MYIFTYLYELSVITKKKILRKKKEKTTTTKSCKTEPSHHCYTQKPARVIDEFTGDTS